MLLFRMPDHVRVAAHQRVLGSMDDDELAEIAVRDTTPSDTLEVLATSTKAKVRVAVALNPACPVHVLKALSTDKAKTVCAAAQRQLLWSELNAPDAPTPKHTREKAAQLETFLLRDHPWTSVPGVKEVLGRLLRDDTWIADHKFVRMCYETLAEMDEELLLEVGPGRFMRALLASMPHRHDYETALEWLWEQLPTTEFLRAVRDNEDILEAKVVREVGTRWKKTPLNAFDGHLPKAWFRVGLTSCPDSLLLEAFDSDSEILASVAGANAQTRPHLRSAVIGSIVNVWEEYTELNVALLATLSDDALLDLPMELIANERPVYDGEETMERARRTVATAVSDIVQERPEAWDVLQVIADDYEGSARELLAALRNL